MSEPTQYDQGVIAGRIEQRLTDHDRHLEKINGSMDVVASRMTEMVQASQDMLRAMQRLGDAADADRATAISLASALEKAETARRDKSVTSWTPLSRVITVVVGLAVVAGAIIAWASLHHR